MSEDIDLLSVGPRGPVAERLDEAIREGTGRVLGPVDADPWLAGARRDTQACLFHFGDVDVRIQLIDGRWYTPWPTRVSRIEQRYAGVPPTELRTYTPQSFVCAKTSAWMDLTRNAPRDLYDLWALARTGCINGDAARLYKRLGPTGGYPTAALLPDHPPAQPLWEAALSHQCRIQAGAADAFRTVIEAWKVAVDQARN